MDSQFTEVDIKNMLALIAIAPIKGSEAATVAILQQKLQLMLGASGATTLAAKEIDNGKSTGTDQPAPTSAE